MNSIRRKQSAVAMAAALAASAVLAQEPKMPEKPGVPTLGQIMEASGVAFSGYIDTSYTYLSGTGAFTSGTPNRVFDNERDSFNLHQLDVTASLLPPAGFGGLVNVVAGSDARVIAAAGTTADDFDVTQAYAHYAAGSVMAIAGKFVTLAGAEVIKAPANANLSRSILFGYAIPFTHTGVRAYFAPGGNAAAPDGKLLLIAGVNNGWDVLRESQQTAAADGSIADGKTLELGVSISPIRALSLAASAYSGDESVGAVTSGRRDLLDVVATLNLSDALSFVLNYDIASQTDALVGGGKAKWGGSAAYVNYKLSDLWRLSLRGEYFDDQDGFRTGVAQRWKESAFTVAYTRDNIELRGEVRYDKSDVASFAQPGGPAENNQRSAGVEAIYKF